MAKTFFGQGCVWMNLINYDELFCLMYQMKENAFDGTIRSIEKTFDERLGERLTVVINRPGTSRLIRGEELSKWEKCKNAVYRHRRIVEHRRVIEWRRSRA